MHDGEIAQPYDQVHKEARETDYRTKATESQIRDGSYVCDVVCGTDVHSPHSVTLSDDGNGLELSQPTIAIAGRSYCAVAHKAEILDFEFGHASCVVTGMTSSIGHLSTTGELDCAEPSFVCQTKLSGVVVVAPRVAHRRLPSHGRGAGGRAHRTQRSRVYAGIIPGSLSMADALVNQAINAPIGWRQSTIDATHTANGVGDVSNGEIR